MISSFVIGAITLFILGSKVGKMSKESQLKTAIKFAVLGIIGAIISYYIGNALGHLMDI
jgi:VIT1/CCC1 family predicted Fe2+/Mn2+ transporter